MGSMAQRSILAWTLALGAATSECGGASGRHLADPDTDAGEGSSGTTEDAMSPPHDSASDTGKPGADGGGADRTDGTMIPDTSLPDTFAPKDTGTPETLSGEAGLMVTWTSGCWYTYMGKKYQAMEFDLVTPKPIPLEGTLFFDTTCDPSTGTDNLNDTGGTTPSGSWLFWFIHHPDEMSTSAIWSLGGIRSACIDYSTAPACP